MKFQQFLVGDEPAEPDEILNRWVTGLPGASQREHLREVPRELAREVGLTGQLSIEVMLAGEVPKKESSGIERVLLAVLRVGLRTLLLAGCGILMASLTTLLTASLTA